MPLSLGDSTSFITLFPPSLTPRRREVRANYTTAKKITRTEHDAFLKSTEKMTNFQSLSIFQYSFLSHNAGRGTVGLSRVAVVLAAC